MTLLRAENDGVLETLDDNLSLVVPLVLLGDQVQAGDLDTRGVGHTGLTGLPLAAEGRRAADEHEELERVVVGLILLQPLDQVHADLGTLGEGDDTDKGPLLMIDVDQLGEIGPLVLLDGVVIIPLLIALAIP